ncbi:MAG: cryptochrome/photolyase family protein, partial [Fimbriimonadales bacterium]|nr:cryptochrome/photolyase family protein [Fimbriimonadales bacterium]
MRSEPQPSCRNLVVVLGDQLSLDAGAFEGFDPVCDRAWMAEVEEEARHVPSHKARIALFLAAMRHFARGIRQRGWPIDYLSLESHSFGSLAEALEASVRSRRPQKVVLVQPGDWRVEQSLRRALQRLGVRLEIRSDRAFVGDLTEFREWALGRKRLLQEHWYRHLRQKTGVLMDGAQPLGGRWNFDSSNREPFGPGGPGLVPRPLGFPPDSVTREVLDLVRRRFAEHPGDLDSFDWPVTRQQALTALRDFVEHRLAAFGRHQDALWTGEPYLHHSRLSAALNLKLLHPIEVVRAAEDAFLRGAAPLESTEGFIRQVLGWREYVRGLYHLWMPEWLDWNFLE